MARRRSSNRKGTFEIGLLLGTTLLSLTIAGLALVGIRFFSSAQSGSCDACHSMAPGPEKNQCYAVPPCGSGYGGSSSYGGSYGGGSCDSCKSGCNSMSDAMSKASCLQGCDMTMCATVTGGGTTTSTSTASCILWKSDLYSNTAGKVVGTEECEGTGKCTRKDLTGNTVSVCGGSASAAPSGSPSGSMSGMSGCTYPNASWNSSNTMGKTPYVTVSVTCTDSDMVAGDCRTSAGEHLGANARNQVSLGAPSTCSSWGGGSSGGGGGSTTCMPGVPGYPDAYSRGPTCAQYSDAGGTGGGTGTSGQQASIKRKEDDPLLKFEEAMDALDYTTMPCLHPLLSLKPDAETRAWREDPKNSELTSWLVSEDGWLYRVQQHGILTMSEMLALPVCQEKDQVITNAQSMDCQKVEADCRRRTHAVYLVDGETVFLERVQTCMDNHPANENCTFSGNLEGIAGEEVGGTCTSDAECDGGWRCDTQNFHERPPRARSPLSAAVLPDVFLGRCVPRPELPEGACEQDADCGEVQHCVYGPQPIGWCEDKEIGDPKEKEDTKDCRPITREMVKQDLLLERGDVTPGDIVGVYEELVKQYLTKQGFEVSPENRAAFEACTLGGKEDGDGKHEAAPEDVAYTFSRAVGLFITILHHAGELPEDFIALVRSATEQFGTWLQDIAEGEEIDLPAAIQLAQSIHDKAPEELRDLVGDERREEWKENATGEIRMMNQEVDATLKWVGRLLDALEKYGYDEATVSSWRASLTRAQELFYKEGGVRDQCLAFISSAMPAPGQELTCDVHEVFAELERTMKEELESCKMMFEGGEAMPSAACIIVGQAMQDPTVGPSPMEEEDHGGPGASGGSCDNRCGGGNIERIFEATDAMPEAEACLSEEEGGEQSAECENVIDALDRENARALFGAQGEMFLNAFHSCMNACENSGGGGGSRQERAELEERCFEASNQAALTACSMHPGTQRVGMGEVDDMLYSMGAEMCIQIHPSNLKVAGVDFDCPRIGDPTENCDQYWKAAEGKCKVNWQMDHTCFRTEVSAFPQQCRPGPNDPIWRTADQWMPVGPGGGGGGMSSMKNCTYPNASKNGQPLGEVFCESDYFHCKKKSTGESVENMGLSLGAPSHCESGWMTGGGSDMICYEANWNNTSGKAYLRCPRSGGSCDDGGMARSLTDPRYSNVREVSCGSMGGGSVGGGGMGASGCFHTAAQKNGQYIGYTVHTNTDGSDPRYGDPNGAPVDMTTGVSLGTEKNCYGPAGSGGGGGSMGGSYPWGCSFGGTTTLQNGAQLISAMCPLESQASNTCTGMSGQGSVTFQPGDVRSWGMMNACAGGYTSGGSTSSYGTYGSCPSSSWRTVSWQRSGGTETTCVGPSVTDTRINEVKSILARDCPGATWFSYANPTDAARPDAGVPSCPSGVSSSVSSASSNVDYMQCVNEAYAVNADGTIGAKLSEYVTCGGVSGGCKGVTSGTIYSWNTMEMGRACDCPKNGQPRDNVFDDCNPIGGTANTTACSYDKATLMSTGAPLSEKLRCDGNGCVGVSSGKKYSSSAVNMGGSCDCDSDGLFDDCGGYSAPMGSSSSQSSGGSICRATVSMPDGSQAEVDCPSGSPPGPCTRVDNGSQISIDMNAATSSGWSCRTAAKEGILHALGTFLRSIVGSL